MRVDKIVNEAPQRVAIIFGRFNPPHYGHKAAWATASKFDQWFVGTNKTTIGEKDPLPYEVKIEAMKAVWPEVANHIMTEQSWFTMASKVYEQLGPVILNVVTDETDKDWIMPVMIQNNGVEGPHGFYNFPKIVWQRAARISSATDLRGAVAKGDKSAFEKAAGVSADTPVAGSTFYEVVSKYLMPYLNAKAEKERIKAERDAAKAAKAKPKKKGVGEGSKEKTQGIALSKAYKKDFDGKKPGQDRAETALTGTYSKTGKPGGELKKKGVAEGAPIVVAQAPIDIRNPKKAPQPYRNKGDIVPPTKPPSTEKRGVKGRPGQRPMPTYEGAMNKEHAARIKELLAKLQELKDKGLTEAHPNSKIYDKCWDGYRKVPGKKRGEEGSCKKESFTPMQLALMEGGHSLYEDASTLSIGDPVIITGKGIEFEGTTGEIVDFGQDNKFVVVNLYNHGKHSFHSSDVSYNDYADSDEEEARMYDRGEFRDDVDEGWKEKAAAAALAGAAAFGGGNAQAQNIDVGQVMHGALGHIGKMSNNPNWNKSVAVGAAQKALNQGVQQHVQQERAADQELVRKITDQRDRQRFASAARDKDYWRQAAINMRTGVDMGKAGAAIAYYKEIKREMMSKYSGQAESVDDKVAGRHDPEDFDAMVSRVGKLAKAGPLKTVWDPVKRVYKNVPVKQDTEEVDEASLATMRKYFAGDTDAKDPTKLAQMRDFFDKHRDEFLGNASRKEFNSISSYQQWLERQGMKKISKDNTKG